MIKTEGTMEWFKKKVEEAALYVKERIAGVPTIGVMAGTGLATSLSGLKDTVALDYKDIPHFPVSTVMTHQGKLLFGEVAGVGVMAMQGRLHTYEGYTIHEITLPIRVMQLLGVKTLIITNAAGGINAAFSPGDIMLIEDHINLTGTNPLIGQNIDGWGPRFPDMTHCYNSRLRELAEIAADREGIGVRKGVYVGLCGPSLETPAEIRFLKTIGADAVGLSTIPEVITAIHGGMSILGLSVITNLHNPDKPQPSSVSEIIAIAETAGPALGSIIASVVAQLSKETSKPVVSFDSD